MWNITIDGTPCELYYPPDFLKMEIELDLRIKYGTTAHLEIKWIPPVPEKKSDINEYVWEE
jgi:hypothetical protein